MEIEILRAIQSLANPVLDVLMEGITMFGEQMLLAAIFCAVYWCYDKELGRFLALVIGASVCLNGVAKDYYKAERPIGEAGIVSWRVETATGYSFPSGHSQNAAAFWGAVLIWTKKAWVRIAAGVLILLTGFSRLYLGVHYLADVACGLVFGLLCAFLLYDILILRKNRKITLYICLAIGAAALLVGESDDTFKGAGMLAGVLGGLFFEEKLVGFEIGEMPFVKKLLRYLAGMALIGVLYAVPRLLLPDTAVWGAVRYAVLVFVATGVYPYLFTKLKI